MGKQQHKGVYGKQAITRKNKMTSTREILTLQIGHYSNYLGAHWWNSQEAGFTYCGRPTDIDHDVLFREGVNSKGQTTFTPRLLLVDLKGSLHHLRAEGELYDCSGPDVSTVPWSEEKIQVDKAEDVPPKSTFLKNLEISSQGDTGGDGATRSSCVYNLEEDVLVWSDYLVSRFHPRSVVVASEFQHNSKDCPFDTHSYGSNMWKAGSFTDEMINRIRQYMEECDNAQGFHLLFDATDGFGGIACGISEHLSDEYDNKSILAIPLIPPVQESITPLQELIRSVNFSFALPKISEYASLVVPLGTDGEMWRQAGSPRSFPYLQFKPQLPYHTSAILAAALDTFSLRYRLRNGSERMSDMVEPMSRLGRRVASCNLGLPFGICEGENLLGALERWEGPLWTSVTPHCNPSIEDIRQKVWMQSVVLRGIPATRLRPSLKDVSPSQNHLNDCETVGQLLQAYLAFCSNGTYSHVSSCDSPWKVTVPYPPIFKPTVGLNGDVLLHGSRSNSIYMRDVPVLASVSSSDDIGSMIRSLHKDTSRFQLSRFPSFTKAGVDTDEYREIRDQLLSLAENYEDATDI